MNHLVSVFRAARQWATPSRRPAASPQAPEVAEVVDPAAAQAAPEQTVADASFEAHVEEALRIIRSAPTLTVVTLPDDTRAARL
jgi:hypothetical protein